MGVYGGRVPRLRNRALADSSAGCTGQQMKGTWESGCAGQASPGPRCHWILVIPLGPGQTGLGNSRAPAGHSSRPRSPLTDFQQLRSLLGHIAQSGAGAALPA